MTTVEALYRQLLRLYERYSDQARVDLNLARGNHSRDRLETARVWKKVSDDMRKMLDRLDEAVKHGDDDRADGG